MTVPLTKVSNHILVLQILIVLDTHTHRQTFHENPHFVSAKGKTKKAVAFGLFVYPNSELRSSSRTSCQCMTPPLGLEKPQSGSNKRQVRS